MNCEILTHTQELLVYSINVWTICNGKIVVVSFVIENGRKLTMGVISCKYQEMGQRKVYLLFLLSQTTHSPICVAS